MAPPDEFELETCRACRATGKVISNLEGTASEVDCPWCEGMGKFIPEHDAQARWAQGDPAPKAGAGAQDAVDG